MFGGNQYWWAGIPVFILFVALNVIVNFLRDKPVLSYRIAYFIAFFLFVYKVGEYIYWQAVGEHLKIPVEFSAVSYFLFGISTTFRLKRFDSFGAFCGFMAGMFFSVASWVSPDSFIANGREESWFLYAMAIINHHALYFGSMLLIANVRRFDPKKFYFMLIGVAVMLGYTWLIYLFTPYADLYGKLIFIRICDGSILNYLFPALDLKPWMTVVYLVVVVIAFLVLVASFYALNNRLADERKKRTGYDLDMPEKIVFGKKA